MCSIRTQMAAALLILGLMAFGQVPARAQGQGTESGPGAAPSPPAQGPADPAELEAFIDGLMAGQMKSYRIAGAVFSLVKDGRMMLAKGYGWSDVARQRPVTAEATLFRCASISKLVTWTAVMQLVERGQLDLKADINSYLADNPVPPTFPEPITLENLMAHSAGFEDLATGLGSIDPGGLLTLDEYLRTYRPKRIYPPGRVTAYSNYSTCLAGAIVAKAAGQPFEDYVEHNIFEPLAMSRSSFRQPLPPALAALVSTGYRYVRGVFQPEGFEYINVGPAGAMSSTAVDMAHFMIAHLQNGLFDGRRLLGEETARLMHQRHFANDPRVTGNAHGFWERQLNGLRWISHGGDTLFFHSYLILCPEKNFGFFVSFNTITGAGNAREDLLQAILDRYYPQPAAPEPGLNPRFLEWARPLEGTYGPTRTAVSNFEKAQELLLNIRVRATKEGTLLTTLPFGLGARQWRPIEPLVFREVGGQDVLVFKQDARGRVTRAFLNSNPLFGLVKRPWFKSPTLHGAFVVLAVVLFLSTLFWPLRGLARLVCRGPQPEKKSPWILRLPALIMSLLFLGFIAGLAVILSRPELIMAGVPVLLKKLMPLPFLASVFIVLSGLAAARAWKRKYWTLCGRAYYSLIVLAGAAFMVFLLYWKLAGFRL